MRKFFDFQGAISGGTYIIRAIIGIIGWYLTTVISTIALTSVSADYPASIDAGIGIAVIVSVVLFAWFALSTISKRINAFKPENKTINFIVWMVLPIAGWYFVLADGTNPDKSRKG